MNKYVVITEYPRDSLVQGSETQVYNYLKELEAEDELYCVSSIHRLQDGSNDEITDWIDFNKDFIPVRVRERKIDDRVDRLAAEFIIAVLEHPNYGDFYLNDDVAIFLDEELDVVEEVVVSKVQGIIHNLLESCKKAVGAECLSN